MLPLIDEHQEEIAQLCERYGVRKLELFGSACRGEFDPENSDLDFLAEFVDIMKSGYVDRYFDFCDGMEALLGKDVDVVTSHSTMSHYFRLELDACKVVIYESEGRAAAA